ncbi:MAG: flavin reductase [Clostridia bacterium]
MNINYKISYGLYVLITGNKDKQNGCIINTLMQQTGNPEAYSITVNKQNYSHKFLLKNEKCAVAILSTGTTFDTIKNFGFRSGIDNDKFVGVETTTSKNGFSIPTKNVVGYLELDITETVDYPTHTQFIGKPTELVGFFDIDPLTYDYYQKHIKPQSKVTAVDGEKSYICNICGYIHKGELPDDIVCPICKHTKQDFQLIEPIIEKPEKQEKQNKFICTVCGYIHVGDTPPDTCPVCMVDKDLFEPLK